MRGGAPALRRRGALSLPRAGRLHLVVVLAAAVAAWGGGARAAAADGEVDALIRKGVEARRVGDDAAALKYFLEAYALQKTPKTLAQIGAAEQALGRWAAADRHMREALEAKGDPWIKKNRVAIETALRTVDTHLGTLDVVGTPAGADVRVDGELVGQLPLPKPIRVASGTVAIEIRAPGYLSVIRAATVNVGQLTRESFSLQSTSLSSEPAAAIGSPPPPPPPPDDGGGRPGGSAGGPRGGAAGGPEGGPAGGPGGGATGGPGGGAAGGPEGAPPEGPGGGVDPPGPAQREGMSTRRVLAFTAIGLSAAALAFGIVEHISWQGKVDDFKSMEPCGSDLTDRGGPGCRSLYDDGQQAKWLAFVGYGAAAAFAAGAAVLYFTDPARTTGSRQLACAPAMSWSSSSITCGLRF